MLTTPAGKPASNTRSASRSALRGGLLGCLEYHRATRRHRWRDLPSRHQQREVPWDDLSGHADWLSQRVGQELAGEGKRDGGTSDLRRPSTHVAEHVDRKRHVGRASDGDGLAVVDRFDLGEFVAVFLEQFGKLPQQFAAPGWRNLAPWPLVERLAGGFNGTVHIRAVGFRDLHENRAGSRVIDGKGFARGRFDQLAVD